MEKETKNAQHKVSSHRLYLGVIAVFVGIILIASNFGIIPYHWKHLLFSWKMILIVIGVVMLAKNDGKPTGYILIGVGAFFLIPELFYFNFDFVKLFWPIVIIFAGIALIFFSKNGRNWVGSVDGFSVKLGDNWSIGLAYELVPNKFIIALDYKQILYSKVASIGNPMNMAVQMGTKEINVAIVRALRNTVSGPNAMDPAQVIDLSMAQWELEIGITF